MTYRMYKLMIATGRIERMQERLDTAFSIGWLTAEQYEELCVMLADKTAQQSNG